MRGSSLLRAANQNLSIDNVQLPVNNITQIANDDQSVVESIELQIDSNHSPQTEDLEEEESTAVECWSRKSKKQRTSKSYLVSNPHLYN